MTDEELRRGVAHAIEPYRDLLERFVKGELSAIAFEKLYLPAYLGDDSDCPDEVFALVDAFFAEADSLVVDGNLRRQVFMAVSPEELKHGAANLLRAAGYAAESPTA